MSLASIIMKDIHKRTEEYANEMESILKDEVHVKSGALQNSITTEKKNDDEFLVGVDVASLKSNARNIGGIDYSLFYWKGHASYVIRPKRAKALRWVGSDGKVHFAKSVQIPAHAGDPFIERAIARRPKF